MTSPYRAPADHRDAKPPKAPWWRVAGACVFRALMHRLDAREDRRQGRLTEESFRPVREARRRALRHRLAEHGPETPHLDCEHCDLLRFARRVSP